MTSTVFVMGKTALLLFAPCGCAIRRQRCQQRANSVTHLANPSDGGIHSEVSIKPANQLLLELATDLPRRFPIMR